MQGETKSLQTGALLGDIGQEQLEKNVSNILRTLEENVYPGQPPAKLVAVTKTVQPNVINRLGALGQWDIGENRVQVALPKLSEIDTQFRLHWIGRLQTNKVKDIIDQVWMLHSLDRLSLAEEVERRASQKGIAVQALVQVNIAQEAQKSGFAIDEVRPFLRRMAQYQHVKVRGLMAIMPLVEDEMLLSGYFRGMRILFDQLRQEAIANVAMEELSMGMSHDYAIAAREGATMVRVGSALYVQ